MTEPERIDVHDARSRMLSADPPLLVLAYEDERKFRLFGLEGAIPSRELEARLGPPPGARELVFY